MSASRDPFGRIRVAVSLQEFHSKPTEDVIDKTLGKWNVVVGRDSHRFESLMRKLRDETLDGDSVLQGDADGSSERVHQTTDC